MVGGVFMKLIVPMARKKIKDTSKFMPPSPLLCLSGKPVLVRVLEVVKSLKISEVIFIVDKDDVDLKRIVSKNFKFKTKYILQRDQKGVAHAIYGAKKFVGDEPCLILFADSIVKADLKSLDKVKADAVIWTKQVHDPRDFGVVFIHNGSVSRLIEKPDSPVSDLAMVGLYYFKKSDQLFEAIAYLIKNKILTKGAYQLTDALQIMINKGNVIVNRNVVSWLDCGSKKRLLDANKFLLKGNKFSSNSKDSVFINPVFIGKGAVISGSVIGPNVSVGMNAKIHNSVVSNSVICEDSVIDSNILVESFIGRGSKIYGSSKIVNVRDRGVVRDE